jgi:hypothetical protein
MQRFTKASLVPAGVLLAVATLVLAPPLARAGDPRIIPVDARPHGLSYGEWLARFSQWYYSLPVDHSPVFDTADLSAGQSGDVWFLGVAAVVSEIEPGVILVESHKSYTIPSGTMLFFPVLSTGADDIDVGGASTGQTEEELREIANFNADFIVPESLSLAVDGVPVGGLADFRVESPRFNIGPLPENNVYADDFDVPAGTTGHGVADGYCVMIKPLSVGRHTIQSAAVVDQTSIGGPEIIFDVRLTINVVPRGQYSPP